MDTQHPSPMIVTLARAQRDVLWELAADDLCSIGDALHHAGRRRALADVERYSAALRALLELLEAIGWDLHDDRPAFPLAIAAENLERLLLRWRASLDGVLRDQTSRGDEPLAPDERSAIDADLDARIAVDQVLEQVTT